MFFQAADAAEDASADAAAHINIRNYIVPRKGGSLRAADAICLDQFNLHESHRPITSSKTGYLSQLP